MNMIWGSIAAFLSGMAGSMGLGGGSVFLLYLTLFAGVEQGTAQGINLLFFIPSAVIALIIYWKKHLIDWKTALLCSSLGVIGALAGAWLSTVIDGGILGKLFGVLLLIMGIKQLFYKKPSSD